MKKSQSQSQSPAPAAPPELYHTQVMTAFTLSVPDEVSQKLRVALREARDGGESWKSLEARTLISDTNLLKIVKKKRPIGPMVAVRLAQALGFELQLSCVKRKRKAA